MKDKKIYFASDFHFGAPDFSTSLEREKKVIKWLDAIKKDAEEIYIVGDVFDFWFEYKHVVPKGYVRFLGKIGELVDKGIKIYFFTGNHDFWMKDYFSKELGVTIYYEPIERTFFNKKYYIGHGDGLGPGDLGYKMLKKLFNFWLSKKLFALLHPDLGIQLANFFSRKSRDKNQESNKKYLGEGNEWLTVYAEQQIKEGQQYDYFIFGHRHLPLKEVLSNGSLYYNLGEWMNYCTYLQVDDKGVNLLKFD